MNFLQTSLTYSKVEHIQHHNHLEQQCMSYKTQLIESLNVFTQKCLLKTFFVYSPPQNQVQNKYQKASFRAQFSKTAGSQASCKDRVESNCFQFQKIIACFRLSFFVSPVGRSYFAESFATEGVVFRHVHIGQYTLALLTLCGCTIHIYICFDQMNININKSCKCMPTSNS